MKTSFWDNSSDNQEKNNALMRVQRLPFSGLFFIYIFRDFGPSPQPTSITFPTVYEETSHTPLERLM